MLGKIKTGSTIIFLLLMLIIGMGVVSASDNATLPLEDSPSDAMLADELSDGKHFEDVDNQIKNAKDGDEIVLKEGVYTSLNNDIETYDQIHVTKSINITGIADRTIFNAKGMDGIFYVSSAGHVVFKNITFTGSILNAAVNVFNTDVDFFDCTFDSNQGGMGGALNVFASESDMNVNIINCTFKNNGISRGAAGVGGAISLGSYDYSLTTNIMNSYFFNNMALRGGAIYVSSDKVKKGYLNIDNSTFESNRLLYHEIDYVEISGCDVGFWGSCEYGVNVSNSVFIDDFDEENVYALSLLLLCGENNLVNNTFLNSKISFESTDATFKNCSFKNSTLGFFNDPYEEYLYESLPAPKSEDINFDVENCTFSDTSAVVGCGVIKNSNFDSSSIYKNSQRDLKIDNCTFSNQSMIRAFSNVVMSNINFIDSTVKFDSIAVKASVSKAYTVSYNCAKKIVIRPKDAVTDELIQGLKLKIKDTNTKKTYYATTNKNGRASFVLDTRFAVGTHNLEITSADSKYSLTKIKTSVKVTKAKTTVTAPKLTVKVKKSKLFKVTVKDKNTKKAVKNVKVKIKVSKKTFNVKTNSKGVAQINTKSLGVGTHKVVISSGNSNYEISAKSAIVVKR